MHFCCKEEMHLVNIIFRNLFEKIAEFKFAFFRVYTWYSVMDSCCVTSIGIRKND